MSNWLEVALYLAGGLAFLLFFGLLFQWAGATRDLLRYPPPGRMVDIGTHELHLHCQGEGTPAVVFDSAIGASCLSWALVQPEVARFTRACSYDRAGFGWSQGGPLPRTAGRAAEELHLLLKLAPVEPPYLLVGHSYGGLTIQMFASIYPGLVAGLVLIDAPYPLEWLNAGTGHRWKLRTGARLCRRGAWAARFGVARLVSLLVSLGALPLARGSVTAISQGALRNEQNRILAPVEKLPAQLRAPLKSLWTRPKFFEALGSQIEFMPESARQVQSAAHLSDIPAVILTASDPTPERIEQQESVCRRFRRARHLVVPGCGHWIPLDQPAAVIEVIRGFVEEIRKGQ